MVGTFIVLRCVKYSLGNSRTLHTCHSYIHGIVPLETCKTLVRIESSGVRPANHGNSLSPKDCNTNQVRKQVEDLANLMADSESSILAEHTF